MATQHKVPAIGRRPRPAGPLSAGCGGAGGPGRHEDHHIRTALTWPLPHPVPARRSARCQRSDPYGLRSQGRGPCGFRVGCELRLRVGCELRLRVGKLDAWLAQMEAATTSGTHDTSGDPRIGPAPPVHAAARTTRNTPAARHATATIRRSPSAGMRVATTAPAATPSAARQPSTVPRRMSTRSVCR